MNLAETSIVQRAWKNEERPTIHGWVFDLKTGLLKPITRVEPNSEIEKIYRFEF